MKQLKFVAAVVLVCASFPCLNESALAQSLAWPASGCTYISSGYGGRGETFHNGIDIACGGDIDILAAASGTISDRTWSTGQCAYDPGYGSCRVCDNLVGNSVRIHHDDSTMVTIYMHMKEVYVSNGDHVECGQVIGKMGTTGCSTGQHLHFTVRPDGSNPAAPLDYAQQGNYTCPVTSTPIISYMQNTDIDGDGAADICTRGVAGIFCTLSSSGNITERINVLELSDDQGWDDVSNYATIRFADVNGDNRADICARGDSGIECWISKGNGEFESYGAVAMSDADGYKDVKYYSTIVFADINGDGKDDFCARFKEQFQCYLSNGNGFDSQPIGFNDMGNDVGWGDAKYYSTIRVADVTGDGKADVCGRGIGGIRCWPSEGDSFGEPFNGPEFSNNNGWGEEKYYSTIRLADINGDHKVDVCARDLGGLICYLSTGNGFGDSIRGPEWKDDAGWAELEHYSTFQFGDINGDGKDDVCMRGNDNFNCYFSNGTGFDEAFRISEFSNANGWDKVDKFSTIHLGDVNGDGRLDVCSRTADKVSCYVYNGSGLDHVEATSFSDAANWNKQPYYSTFRFGGIQPKACSFLPEICDGKDNNCDGQIDEGNVCCTPSDEICDGQDNDCDGQIDEDNVCEHTPQCTPSDEICDGQDNDCDGQIDEDNVCEHTPQCTPSDEICDGRDNDCDGQIDEDGICDGGQDCVPVPEICDDKDNDCDGAIDEDGVCDDDGADFEPEDPKPVCDPETGNCDGKCLYGKDADGNCIDKETDESYADDDCGCTSTRRPTGTLPVGAVLAVFGMMGTLVIRRRRDIQK